jgi:hypothetical protein
MRHPDPPPSGILSRRRLLGWAVAAPAAVATGVVAAQVGRRAGLLRPGASGTSASRCAQCGGADHTMLAAACPAAPDLW